MTLEYFELNIYLLLVSELGYPTSPHAVIGTLSALQKTAAPALRWSLKFKLGWVRFFLHCGVNRHFLRKTTTLTGREK